MLRQQQDEEESPGGAEDDAEYGDNADVEEADQQVQELMAAQRAQHGA